MPKKQKQGRGRGGGRGASRKPQAFSSDEEGEGQGFLRIGGVVINCDTRGHVSGLELHDKRTASGRRHKARAAETAQKTQQQRPGAAPSAEPAGSDSSSDDGSYVSDLEELLKDYMAHMEEESPEGSEGAAPPSAARRLRSQATLMRRFSGVEIGDEGPVEGSLSNWLPGDDSDSVSSSSSEGSGSESGSNSDSGDDWLAATDVGGSGEEGGGAPLGATGVYSAEELAQLTLAQRFPVSARPRRVLPSGEAKAKAEKGGRGKGGSARKSRPGVKGALGGKLAPGEKKRLRREAREAKRAARAAVRGFDLAGINTQLHDFVRGFVAGGNDCVALPPGGKAECRATARLASLYGCRAALQGGSSKRKGMVVREMPPLWCRRRPDACHPPSKTPGTSALPTGGGVLSGARQRSVARPRPLPAGPRPQVHATHRTALPDGERLLAVGRLLAAQSAAERAGASLYPWLAVLGPASEPGSALGLTAPGVRGRGRGRGMRPDRAGRGAGGGRGGARFTPQPPPPVSAKSARRRSIHPVAFVSSGTMNPEEPMELVPPKMAPPKLVVTPKALAAAAAAAAHVAPPESAAGSPAAPAAEAEAPAVMCAVFEATSGDRGDEEGDVDGSHPGLGSAAAAIQYTRASGAVLGRGAAAADGITNRGRLLGLGMALGIGAEVFGAPAAAPVGEGGDLSPLSALPSKSAGRRRSDAAPTSPPPPQRGRGPAPRPGRSKDERRRASRAAAAAAQVPGVVDEAAAGGQGLVAGDYGDFERHTTGIGSKLLAKWGFAGEGSGLGRAQQGIAEPLRASRRAKGLGLGAG